MITRRCKMWGKCLLALVEDFLEESQSSFIILAQIVESITHIHTFHRFWKVSIGSSIGTIFDDPPRRLSQSTETNSLPRFEIQVDIKMRIAVSLVDPLMLFNNLFYLLLTRFDRLFEIRSH